MKTKILLVLLVGVILAGCTSSNNESKVSAESPPYWEEVARQDSGIISGGKIITYSDNEGHVIVVVGQGNAVAVTQIFNDKK